MKSSNPSRARYQLVMPVTSKNLGKNYLKGSGPTADPGQGAAERRLRQQVKRLLNRLVDSDPSFDREAALEGFVFRGDRPILPNVHADKLPTLISYLENLDAE